MYLDPKNKVVISVLVNAISDAVESNLNDLDSSDMNLIIQNQLDHENDYEVDELLGEYIENSGRTI
jgi:hypothetical protein